MRRWQLAESQVAVAHQAAPRLRRGAGDGRMRVRTPAQDRYLPVRVHTFRHRLDPEVRTLECHGAHLGAESFQMDS